MNAAEDNPTLPVDEAALIDALVADFGRAWSAGQRPRIEDYLERVDRAVRPMALRQLLQADVRERWNRRESVNISDYADRFPDVDQGVFETQVARETLSDAPSDPHGGLRIRCSQCLHATGIAPDADLESIHCTKCGSNFSLTEGDERATHDARGFVQLGHFKLVARLGMGAFGTVWKAQDDELDRTVAVKIPRASQFDKKRQDYFIREARAAAQLRHPNIVPVYEVGREGDMLYIISEFVRGTTLADKLESGPMEVREAAELCFKIAQALHHAHERGVIHRDLKPANVMIDAAGEPHLMDFGLARREAGEVRVTSDGQVLGTPAYMSPEQAQGEAHAADRRSDVYSLGVVLYEMLTGRLPFQGNVQMVLHQVLHNEPPSLRKLNANVPRDLETIALKCLQKQPQRRFSTADELAEECARYLVSDPIRSRPVTPAHRALQWAWRQPLATVAVAALLASPIMWRFLGNAPSTSGEATGPIEQGDVQATIAENESSGVDQTPGDERTREYSTTDPARPRAADDQAASRAPGEAIGASTPAKKKIKLELTSLECIEPNDLDGTDQVQMTLVVDGGQPLPIDYPHNFEGQGCINMRSGGKVMLGYTVSFESEITAIFRELDGVPGSIGKAVITPETIAQGIFSQTMVASGFGKHRYRFAWRQVEPTEVPGREGDSNQ